MKEWMRLKWRYHRQLLQRHWTKVTGHNVSVISDNGSSPVRSFKWCPVEYSFEIVPELVVVHCLRLDTCSRFFTIIYQSERHLILNFLLTYLLTYRYPVLTADASKTQSNRTWSACDTFIFQPRRPWDRSARGWVHPWVRLGWLAQRDFESIGRRREVRFLRPFWSLAFIGDVWLRKWVVECVILTFLFYR